MKTTIFILLLFFSLTSTCQNLLLNGDFEDYTSCPTSESGPFQNPYEITKCIGWTAPTYGTSDYLNICSTSPVVGIPSLSLGYQLPYTGNGYLGAFFVGFGGSGTDGYNGTMWWEYVQGQFVRPLEANKIYQIKFYISLADVDLAVNEFGAYISVNAISSLNTANLTVTPQLTFITPTYFKDTANWVAVEGLYMAQGGEKYLTIGNFNSDIDTDTLRIQSFGDPEPLMAYYFIDAAETIDATGEQPISNVFTPNGDGNNDVWKLPFTLADYEISIYNRWGNQIIKSNAYNFSWDGKTHKGKKCNDGVYYYLIKQKNNPNNTLKGFIQLFNH